MAAKSNYKTACGIAVLLAFTFTARTATAQSRNNPYSPSPAKHIAEPASNRQPTSDGGVTFKLAADSGGTGTVVERTPITDTPFKVAKPTASRATSPTDIYKIGIGDVLFVNLKNASNGSGYFTVQPDGSIDYPLAGENVIVANHTVDLAAEIIAGGIKLYSSPQVDVKVRQYASHKVSVTGMVDNPGEKSLQREAMPLYAIRAEAVPKPTAKGVRIRRAAGGSEEQFDLSDPQTAEKLVYPGDRVHFFSDSVSSSATYFIGGEIQAGGQKELATGLTLYQAVIASGGTKGDPKKAIIRRKDQVGKLESIEHNLRSIKAGKAMDPFVAPGDIIEIRK
jgi:polysaccharide export outer membrane protein